MKNYFDSIRNLTALFKGEDKGIVEHGCWSPRWIFTRYASQRHYELGLPFEVSMVDGNLLTTNGANTIWTTLTGTGITAYNSTNAQIGAGDSATAASAAQTDLQAALATKINAADTTSASNATPIVVAGTYSPTPLVGEVYALSGFGGAGAAAINQTFELSVASAASITLLNSAGTGAITVAGGVIQKVNKYRQIVNGAPVVSTNQVSFTSVFAAANANHVWQEFGTFNNAAATNKQVVGGTMLNRLVSNQGTKASGAVWTITEQITLT